MAEQQWFPCDLCGGTLFVKVGSAGLYARRTKVCVCRTCGLACLNPRWGEGRYAAYYAHEYPRHPMPVTAYDARADAIADLVDQIAPLSAPILDIGAGNGGVLWRLRGRGRHDLHAIEVDPACQGDLRTLGLTVHAYDDEAPAHGLLVLNHVLEHVVHPVAWLQAWRHRMSPDAQLVIVVPMNWGPVPSRSFTVPHTHYFTAATLARTVAAAGFTVVSWPLRDRPDDITIVVTPGDVVPAVDDPMEVRLARKACAQIEARDRLRSISLAVLQAVVPERLFWRIAQRRRTHP